MIDKSIQHPTDNYAQHKSKNILFQFCFLLPASCTSLIFIASVSYYVHKLLAKYLEMFLYQSLVLSYCCNLMYRDIPTVRLLILPSPLPHTICIDKTRIPPQLYFNKILLKINLHKHLSFKIHFVTD